MTDELKDLRKLDLPFDVDKVIPQCHECVRNQLKKYEKFVFDGKPVGGKFLIPCKGIKKDIVSPLEEATKTDKQLEVLKASRDNVEFAKAFARLPGNLPWIARWYQEAVLRCTSRRKVLRIGRRTGKCIAGQCKVLTENGPINANDLIDLPNKPSIATFNQETGEVEFASNYTIWANGHKETYKLTTQYGKETVITDNHPFLTMSSSGQMIWRELKDLSVGDMILVPADYSSLQFKESSISSDVARLLGYLTGDGSLNYKYASRITNIDDKILNDIRRLIGDFDCELTPLDDQSYCIVSKNKDCHVKYRNSINNLLDYHDMRHTAHFKRVPKDILVANKKAVSNFLSGYWDTDGWACISKTGNPEIGISTASQKLSKDIQFLLMRLGIFANRSYKKVKHKGEYRDNWTIVLADRLNIEKFHRQITLTAKQQQLDTVYKYICNRKSSTSDYQYLPTGIINYISKEQKAKIDNWELYKRENGLSKHFRVARHCKCITKEKTSVFASILNDEYLTWLTQDKFVWEKITNISSEGKQQTYDLNVPETSTLIADNIISHNTDSVCMEILYKLYTSKDRKIFVTGPQKIHVEEIFIRLRKFISSHSMLRDSVIRDAKAPYYEILLRNGSRVRGVPAGAKGKKDGLGGRGQDADDIYVEEMDYVDASALRGAIFPIMYTTPETSLCGFSTPTGFKTPYYSLCEESPHYKEFHYTYKVLPHYKQVEAEKGSFTEEEWKHEYCFNGYQEVTVLDSESKCFIKKHIKNIKVGDKVFSTQDKQLVDITNVFKNSNRKTIKYFTDSGTIDCTNDHGFRNRQGTKTPVSALKEIPFSYYPIYLYSAFKKQKLARLIGFLNGDGYVADLSSRYSARFYGEKIDLQNICIDINSIYSTSYSPYFKSSSTNSETWCVEVNKEISEDLVRLGGLFGKKTEQDNVIPEWILNESKHIQIEFFGGLWGAEGSTPKPVGYTAHSLSINMTLKTNKLMYQLQDVLYKFNIESTVKENTLYIKNDINIQKFCKLNPVRYCTSKEILHFYLDLYFKERNRLYYENFENHRLVYSERTRSDSKLSILFEKYNVSKSSFYKWIKNKDRTGHKKYGQIKTKILKSSDWFKSKLVGNLCYMSILKEETNGIQPTYNIEVNSSDHSYILTNNVETFNCAEWGTAESGVYQPAYIDRALTKYEYSSMVRNPSWRYVIGTDWNEKKGTEIVVLGFNPFSNTYHVVDVEHIERSEFTQLEGVSKLLAMNQKWMPNYIYIDAGNGSTNYELLRKTAWEHTKPGGNRITANLLTILKKYDSGASLEIKDPVTHQKEKKPAKPFMVNASVRLFEQNLVRISSYDEKLVKQFRNYIVDRISPNGTTIYGVESEKIGDHRLDAFNLAAVGFALEFSNLHSTVVSTEVAAIVDPRSKNTNHVTHAEKNDKFSSPQERRLDGEASKSLLEKDIFTRIPGKLDNQRNTVQTNRLGWDIDREEEEMEKYKQRKKTRGRSRTDRPTRSNI